MLPGIEFINLTNILIALGILLVLYLIGGAIYEWERRQFIRSFGDTPAPLCPGIRRWFDVIKSWF